VSALQGERLLVSTRCSTFGDVSKGSSSRERGIHDLKGVPAMRLFASIYVAWVFEAKFILRALSRFVAPRCYPIEKYFIRHRLVGHSSGGLCMRPKIDYSSD